MSGCTEGAMTVAKQWDHKKFHSIILYEISSARYGSNIARNHTKIWEPEECTNHPFEDPKPRPKQECWRVKSSYGDGCQLRLLGTSPCHTVRQKFHSGSRPLGARACPLEGSKNEPRVRLPVTLGARMHAPPQSGEVIHGII